MFAARNFSADFSNTSKQPQTDIIPAGECAPPSNVTLPTITANFIQQANGCVMT